MSKPTMVTIAESGRVGLEVAVEDDVTPFLNLGFQASKNHERVYLFRSPDETDVFSMVERLRDMGIPLATHRHGGADYFVEVARTKGFVRGKFIRVNFFGNDFDADAPFKVEEF
ncbi:hypothetical protein [Neorhizobium sp. SHOUNA12B]|nr:hypothetical protein [Neorhizobium sp. SHOUNA12B]MCJ9673605.1 hypothetical protein [Neorhizobium sp. SHOUNA12B]MCJ9748490.1 hypothetical protein [Neorhizobium sp. SHOUNA12A]